MCARLCAPNDLAELRQELGSFIPAPNAIGGPSWNVSGNSAVAVLFFDAITRVRRLARMRWGLIAARGKDTLVVHLTEDCGQNRHPSRGRSPSRRCLIPVRHFYEWRSRDRQPFAIGLANRQLMTIAGLWERRVNSAGLEDARFLILTTDPNGLVAEICSRMPVIVPPELRELWLEGEDSGKSPDLPVAFPSEKMISWTVKPELKFKHRDGTDLAEEWMESAPQQ